MTEPLKHTLYGDAPLSTAKNPDAAASAGAGPAVRSGDELVGRTVTINRSRHEVYEFWRDLRNLPLFMPDIQRIDVLDSTRSRWTVQAPGKMVQWESLITDNRADELIAWESQENADVRNSGRVEFRDAPAGRGTEVTATIIYAAPGGSIGKLIAKIFQKEPMIQARRDLRRFKQLMETGEISTAQPPDAAPRA